MKHIIAVVMFSLLPFTGWAQARISVSESIYDFGIIDRNKPVSREIMVTNLGDKPLVLNNVTTSCACTVAGWTKTPIAPGGKGFVKATFDAKMMGRFYKYLSIYSNATNPLVRVGLKGEVAVDVVDYKLALPYSIGSVLLDTRSVEFEPASRGEKPKVVIQLTNASDKAIEIILMHLPPYLTMEAMPRILSHGRKGVITLTLDTRKLKDYGLTQTSIFLARYMGDKVNKDNEIDVSSILLPDFSNWTETQMLNAPQLKISSTKINMGKLTRGSKSSVLTLTNVGKQKLSVEKLQVFNPAVSVDLKKRNLMPGESTTLKVKVTAKWLKQYRGKTRVLMITNTPARSMVMIDIKIDQ
jgi:hypothetical protein